MADQRLSGTVKTLDAVSGQGVVLRDDGEGELYLDVFALNRGDEFRIRPGTRVEFALLAHTTGPRAEAVTVLTTSDT